jgi:hypothetical protein
LPCESDDPSANLKSEADEEIPNPESETPNRTPYQVWDLDLGIWFGFRISGFGFPGMTAAPIEASLYTPGRSR